MLAFMLSTVALYSSVRAAISLAFADMSSCNSATVVSYSSVRLSIFPCKIVLFSSSRSSSAFLFSAALFSISLTFDSYLSVKETISAFAAAMLAFISDTFSSCARFISSIAVSFALCAAKRLSRKAANASSVSDLDIYSSFILSVAVKTTSS